METEKALEIIENVFNNITKAGIFQSLEDAVTASEALTAVKKALKEK